MACFWPTGRCVRSWRKPPPAPVETPTDSPSSTPCVSSAASWLPRQPFPPEARADGLRAILAEIVEERCGSSRGRPVPRGVKRKMSGYPLRGTPAPIRPINYPIKIFT